MRQSPAKVRHTDGSAAMISRNIPEKSASASQVVGRDESSSTKTTRTCQQHRKKASFTITNAAAAILATKFRLQGSFENPIHHPGAQTPS